ncbi:hypothetical protein EJB05_54929, partial [Eragrostis curvula]
MGPAGSTAARAGDGVVRSCPFYLGEHALRDDRTSDARGPTSRGGTAQARAGRGGADSAESWRHGHRFCCREGRSQFEAITWTDGLGVLRHHRLLLLVGKDAASSGRRRRARRGRGRVHDGVVCAAQEAGGEDQVQGDAAPGVQGRVRSRNPGRWVCEVREPHGRQRLWLGTFETAEMAARAHDVAALALRGSAACLNFADSPRRLRVPPPGAGHDEIRRAAVEAAELFVSTSTVPLLAPESAHGPRRGHRPNKPNPRYAGPDWTK